MTLESIVSQQAEAEAQRVHLTVNPDDPSCELDETLIAAALGNLLDNALRYSPAGSQVRIQVIDHGPGLDDEALAKLGTPYFRAETSLGKKGSGLGYHFTQRIVRAHDGRLYAHSGQGEGLTVEVVLPWGQTPTGPDPSMRSDHNGVYRVQYGKRRNNQVTAGERNVC